jgi:Galactose-3-O-sulfotransferase
MSARSEFQFVPGGGAAGGLQGRPLIFVHVPRTGGTTLTRLLRQRFDSEETFVASLPRTVSAAEEFAALPAAARGRVRLLLIGHDEFSEDEAWPQNAVFITLLRDPVRRVISTYRFIHDHPADPLHEPVVAGGMSLREFVTSDLARSINNWQVRCLAGVSKSEDWGPEVVARAKENIERTFTLVGLNERFSETVALLSAMFGLKRLHYAPLNVSRAPAAVGPDDVEVIRELNALDCELYAFAAARFAEQMARVPGVERELRDLSRRNQLYAPLDGAYRQARHLLHLVRSRSTG